MLDLPNKQSLNIKSRNGVLEDGCAKYISYQKMKVSSNANSQVPSFLIKNKTTGESEKSSQVYFQVLKNLRNVIKTFNEEEKEKLTKNSHCSFSNLKTNSETDNPINLGKDSLQKPLKRKLVLIFNYRFNEAFTEQPVKNLINIYKKFKSDHSVQPTLENFFK
jgi:hypothetical protein